MELILALFVYALIRYSETIICAMSGLSVPKYDSACDWELETWNWELGTFPNEEEIPKAGEPLTSTLRKTCRKLPLNGYTNNE